MMSTAPTARADRSANVVQQGSMLLKNPGVPRRASCAELRAPSQAAANVIPCRLERFRSGHRCVCVYAKVC